MQIALEHQDAICFQRSLGCGCLENYTVSFRIICTGLAAAQSFFEFAPECISFATVEGLFNKFFKKTGNLSVFSFIIKSHFYKGIIKIQNTGESLCLRGQEGGGKPVRVLILVAAIATPRLDGAAMGRLHRQGLTLSSHAYPPVEGHCRQVRRKTRLCMTTAGLQYMGN